MHSNLIHAPGRRRTFLLAAAVLSTLGVLGACADPVSTGTTQVDPAALGDSKVLPVSFDTSADAKDSGRLVRIDTGVEGMPLFRGSLPAVDDDVVPR